MTEEVKAPEVSETDKFVSTSSDAPAIEGSASDETEVAAVIETEAESASVDDGDVVASGNDATAEKSEKPKGNSKTQKRIDKLVREREEANRRVESLQAQLDSNLEKTEVIDSEPLESDFESYDEYLGALDKFDSAGDAPGKADPKEVESSGGNEGGATFTDSQKTAMALLTERTDEAAERYADFKEVALAQDVAITAVMVEGLAECEDPAKVMMYLGLNKEVAADIANKSPAQQMVALARLDMTAKVRPSKPANNSKAADPISPVHGSDAQTRPLSEQSFSEYEATMNAREQKGSSSW